MTFLNEIKNELLNLRIKKQCCMASEVRGILTFGAVGYGDGALFGTESFEEAKRISIFLRKVCNIDFAERLDEEAGSYKFVIPESILSELGLEVNGNLIAKGDVVVIDDNFAVRITEIIKSKFLDSLSGKE